MAKFIEKESFKHKMAKELLLTWLTEINNANDYCVLNPITWRSNYGVFSELKFHETDDPYYFENSKGLKEYFGHDKELNDLRGKNPIDWFDEMYNRGKILFVPDITIFHKGTATILIEILHTNIVSDKKIKDIAKFFNGHYVTIFEIRAEDILNMTEVPTSIPVFRQIEL